MKLDSPYIWLLDEPGPKMLHEALKLYGTQEVLGDGHNPVILHWAKELGLEAVYTADSIPWCGLFVGIVAKHAGKNVPANPLWARNWATWGDKTTPELGAVMVFSRGPTSGHVGLYVGEDDNYYHILGGNQSDKVCVTRIEKKRLLAARNSYKVKPQNIRTIRLASTGAISRNEA